MSTASTPRPVRAETAAERRRCATRFRRSGSVSSRTPSRSTKTVAWPTYSIRAMRESLYAVSESLRLGKGFELLERVVIDLADALALDAERLPDVLGRARLRAFEPVPQLDDTPLAIGERGQGELDVLPTKGERRSVER